MSRSLATIDLFRDQPPSTAVDKAAGSGRTLQEALRSDLGFHGSSGKYATHGWHPFPAKFPPQLPHLFIETLSVPGETVLDPMVGSGTTLVEAQRLGRRAIGCDIDPLARMISAAKLTPTNPVDALIAGREILEEARRIYRLRREELEADRLCRFDAKTLSFVDYWFPMQQQLELLSLLKCIEALTAHSMRQFFQVVFSSTIIAKSGGVSLARDLAHTRPHRVLDKNPVSAFVEFEKRLKNNLRSRTNGENGRNPYPNATEALGDLTGNGDAPDRRIACFGESEIFEAPADNTGLPEESVDLIVTSPPYANNAIDYMRAHKFSLVWLGWQIDDLTNIRKQYLGHDALGNKSYTSFPEQCESTLAALEQVDRKKSAVLRRYFGEMRAVIREMYRVLKQGKAAVIVVGTSTLRGIDVETHKGLAAIGENMGFDLAGMGIRHLDRDKRMMPARWGKTRQSKIEERMHEEYVIGLLKP